MDGARFLEIIAENAPGVIVIAAVLHRDLRRLLDRLGDLERQVTDNTEKLDRICANSCPPDQRAGDAAAE